MKKLLFAIAICGFVFTSCGNKTKATASDEKTETTVELKKDSSKCCAAKAECTKDSTSVATEAKAECKKDSAAVVTEAKAECKKDSTAVATEAKAN